MAVLFNYAVIFFASIHLVNSQDTKVNTKLGEIVGKEIIVPLDLPYKKVNTYLGIPFAKPPVGDMRFRKPEPVTSLPSPFYAQNFSAMCPQITRYAAWKSFPQSEDCLYLNVYVPDRPSEIPGGHAVMIWIHGGGFQEGTGSQYDFSALSLTGNIIVVTFNYRVGIFGFLTSSDENARGNYGIWDQHLAFQWVHDNIRDFGGSTERVTIAGESAGAMSVTQHALIPANRGLFQRIIAQSMSMPGLNLGKDWSKDVHVLAENVGCKTDNMFDIIECLRATNVQELLAQQIRFSPTLDGDLIKINTVDIAKISETRSLDEVEFFRSLDMMSGFNANEGASMLPLIMFLLPKEMQNSNLENLTIGYNDWINHYLPAVMYFARRTQFPEEILQLAAAQYTPWPTPYDYQLLRLQFEKLAGDLIFAIPAIQMARLHASSYSSSENNFMYHFAPKPSIRSQPAPSWVTGAGHTDEIMFVMGAFGMLGVGEENAWENDLMIKMMTYWSNFVKSGNPNFPELISPYWSKYDAEIGDYLLLNKTMTDMPGPRFFYAEEANFWLHVFPDLVDAVSGSDKGHCGDGISNSAANDVSVFNLVFSFALSLYTYVVRWL